MRKISNDKILSKIPVPKSLPIDIDKNTYLNNTLREVRKHVDKGMNVDKAIKRVTGNEVNKTRGRGSKYNKKNNGNKLIITIISIISCLILCAICVVIYTTSFKPQNVSALTEEVKSGTNENEMILVAGLDTRPAIDSGYGNSEEVPGTRTDMLALVSIPKDGSRATIVSIPRDTSVTRSQCKKYDTQSGEYSEKIEDSEDNVKINSVYNIGGPKCLVTTLDDTFHISINRYMEIDFEIFKYIVDAVGGIDITTDKPIIDDTLGVIIDKAGTFTLNGDKALDYVRARKVQGTVKNDFDRIQRQQQFFTSLMKKLFSDNKINDTSFINSLATNVLPMLKEDNVSLDDLIKLGYSLSNMDKSSIRLTTLPISDEDMTGNLIFDKVNTKILFDALKDNTPLQGDMPTSSSSSNSYTVNTVGLNGMNIVIVTHNQFDERAQELVNYFNAQGAQSSIVTSNDVPDDSTIYYDKDNVQLVTSIASIYPDLLLSNNDTPVNKASKKSAILTIGNNYDIVFHTAQKLKVNAKISIPKDYNGEGYQIIPRELPGMTNYPSHTVNE